MAMPEAFVFRVTATDGTARRGQIDTPHGRFETPAFMPVGTAGTVKALTGRDLLDIGAEIILANTYHLLLRPGDDVIARCGGLHAFMGWDGPILTDSGGYQVFSLGDRRVVTEDGARFRSHLDGSEHLLTPERAVEIQARLGSDIAMAFDECTPYPVSRDVARASMELSLRWGRRSRVRFRTLAQTRDEEVTNRRQAQFGIVQGGVFPDLRARSVEETLSVGFDGYAIGGLSVGEPAGVMCDVAAGTAHALPPDRPRYLMGVGTPSTSSRWWPVASTCSIASSRPETPETGSCSPGRGQSTSRARDTPRIGRHPTRPAAATRAGTTRERIYDIYSWPARSPRPPSTRYITYTSTLTP